jgi:hypothetical protein
MGPVAQLPAFASLVQLLNSDRIASGKATLGFLNPWLYSSATSGLTDIRSGKNTGCSGVISGARFLAVPVSFLNPYFIKRQMTEIPSDLSEMTQIPSNFIHNDSNALRQNKAVLTTPVTYRELCLGSSLNR